MQRGPADRDGKDTVIEMKRVLWICNIMLPVIARKLSLPYSNREGWLSGIFEQQTAERAEREIALGICFPAESAERKGEKSAGPLMVSGVPCYGFAENLEKPELYDSSLEVCFREIFEDFKPDMIHVFGTEFPHALAAVRAFGKPERTLVGIQGLCYRIEQVYAAGLPPEVFGRVTFRDFIRQDSMKRQQEKFRLRGENEKEIIRLTGHITGRTAFDREGTGQVNPKAEYHLMNETMRGSFYEGCWKEEGCLRHSIFLGQGDYPLKGFHFLLEAMPEILAEYPDAVLYVAGNSVIGHGSVRERLKLPAYGKYLLELIRKYKLADHVVMLGRLTEEEMKEHFLSSHVFVCPSVLENSPNTVGEAMLLGVPVAASRAGGIPDLLADGQEGLLFTPGNSREIAQAVCAVFDGSRDGEGRTLAQRLSAAGRKRARVTHDGKTNCQRLMEIYRDITGG